MNVCVFVSTWQSVHCAPPGNKLSWPAVHTVHPAPTPGRGGHTPSLHGCLQVTETKEALEPNHTATDVQRHEPFKKPSKPE